MKLSIEIETYLPMADDSLISPWISGLETLGMKCEFHPGFSFAGLGGFLPIKLRLESPTRKSFENIDFLSGFELYLEDFDFVEFSKSKMKPRRRFLHFMRPLKSKPSTMTQEVEAILATCKKRMTFRFSTSDLFELRLADMSSILLTEIVDGVRFFPADDEWHCVKGDASRSLQAIEEFERSLPENGFTVHPFEDWL